MKKTGKRLSARKANAPRNGLPALTDEQLLELARNFWLGGDSNKKNVRVDEVPEEQLAIGVDEELEHSPDKLFAFKVALDHLSISPRYYLDLREMERKLKGY